MFNRKEQLQHRAVSLRQHGFLVHKLSVLRELNIYANDVWSTKINKSSTESLNFIALSQSPLLVYEELLIYSMLVVRHFEIS